VLNGEEGKFAQVMDVDEASHLTWGLVMAEVPENEICDRAAVKPAYQQRLLPRQPGSAVRSTTSTPARAGDCRQDRDQVRRRCQADLATASKTLRCPLIHPEMIEPRMRRSHRSSTKSLPKGASNKQPK